MNYDVIIIGAGPAGLAASHRLKSSNLRTLLIDAGRRVGDRTKDDEAFLTQGHGGAGLYSDGKFSFFPSASALWSLPRRSALRDAYEWTCHTLNRYDLNTPPLPSNSAAYTEATGEWVLKSYPSDYLSLENRLKLTQDLVGASGADLLTGHRVVRCHHDPQFDGCHVEISNDLNYTHQITTKRLIIASGRFGPLDTLVDETPFFRRLEVGFRIEQPTNKSFFSNLKQLDPKLKLKSKHDDVEWRTFCACRNGDTVFTNTLGLWTVSGHSDCPPSGRSNVGFNTRILDPDTARMLLPPLLEKFRQHTSYFKLNLINTLCNNTIERNRLTSIYGSTLCNLMLLGLSELIKKFPEIYDPDTFIIGPTLEGVGWYPKLNGDLRVADQPLWIAGDACGLFRGIVAALISGHYTASSVIEDLGKIDQWQHVSTDKLVSGAS